MLEKTVVTYEESYNMRKHHVGKSCKLHFEVAPLKITRASKQYMYDDVGNEYLDCISTIAHVGHCHPHVVSCGQRQMAQLATSNGFLSDQMALYTKRLLETLPDRLCVCYFVNSGSEANDLALQLAKSYTGAEDVICVENSFHGHLDAMLDISPLRYKASLRHQKDHVHVVPCPDVYRGKYRDAATSGEKYAAEVRTTLHKAQEGDRKIAAFISECHMFSAGVINPPQDYFRHVYRYVREAGALCIADEVQAGLGRSGDCWSFHQHGVVPDIVTCGKPLGNGHPMAIVVTTKEIADCLGEFNSSFGGNPVSCAIGMAVLDVVHNEKLMSSAKCVGLTLLEEFRAVQHQHPMMGDVRGSGLMVGVEIVTDKESRKPAGEAAELLAYKMKERKMLVSAGGPDKNVISLSPPMCFTNDNARSLVGCLHRCLSEIESVTCPDLLRAANLEIITEPTEITIPPEVLNMGGASGGVTEDDDDGEPGAKVPRYEDID